MRGIIFKTVKEGFRRLHKQHKSEVARKKRSPNTAPPVIPMDLKKADFKRKIRGTKFMTAAEYKAAPKSKSIPRGGRPRIFGKAYASDKRGKSMQIPMMTKKQRAANQEAISQSVRKFMKDKIGRKAKGGMQKMLLGGLLTAGIKSAAKKYFKSSNKTQDIVKKSKVSRKDAKADVKSGIRDVLKGRLKEENRAFNKDKSNFLIRRRRLMTIRNLNKLK